MGELQEETGMIPNSAHYFYSYTGTSWLDFHGNETKNEVKVFIVKALGTPKPCNEIKAVAWWTPNSDLKLKNGVKTVIDNYLNSPGN